MLFEIICKTVFLSYSHLENNPYYQFNIAMCSIYFEKIVVSNSNIYLLSY